MPGPEFDDAKEKTRQCPTCRMAISVLATKCRYCGENVGRPKEAARQLSIDDLGGESSSKFSRNDDVMEALEAYRREEYTQQTPKDEGRAGRKRDSGPNAMGQTPLGQLVPGLDSPPAGYEDESPRPAPRPKPKRPLVSFDFITDNLKPIGGVIAAIFVLAAAVAGIRALGAGRAAPPPAKVENRARDILAAGGSTLDALQVAKDAVNKLDNEENRKILEEVRDRIKADVEKLLNEPAWSVSLLDKASTLIAQAATADPASDTLRNLEQDVRKEVCLYKLVIEGVNPAGDEVTLRVTRLDTPPMRVVVRKGETVEGRLKVTDISQDHVRFQDTLRKNVQGQPREIRVSRDGTVTVL